jgi:hypothetical protein
MMKGTYEHPRGLCSLMCQCFGIFLVLVPAGYAWTLAELTEGKGLCHERVSEFSCDGEQGQRTDSAKMTEGREISSFADLQNIYSPVLDNACKWNPIAMTCEYRCNHLYQFPPFRVSEKINLIRTEGHYIFQQYGAACTAFNIAPETNNNKECTICMDPNFNPPECYKKKDANGKYIEKADDCMTKCNFLPNCTAVCTNLVKRQVLYRDKPEEVAFMDCCMPQRQQLNGETLDRARESCCREYKLLQGYEVHIARNICCNAIETTFHGHTPYCSSELCHFRLTEENISNNRDIWTENTLQQAMAEDCNNGECSVLGIVTRTSDGHMGTAMENNFIFTTEPAKRSQEFFNIVLRELPFNAPLNSDTVKIATNYDTYFPESVPVGSFFFNAYFKLCNVNDPCKLQEGVQYENLKKKYMVLYRALLASGRYTDAVQEMQYRQKALEAWENTLPPYVPPLPQFAVPTLTVEPSHLPVYSAIDHFHSLQAVRRRALGAEVETQYGPAVGSQRVSGCISEDGLMCTSKSGARQYNRRRRSCRPMSLFHPDEVHYTRPPWRFDLDLWLGSFGEFGQWKANFSNWRSDHVKDMRR